jgi:hypothetical protein
MERIEIPLQVSNSFLECVSKQEPATVVAEQKV